MDERQEGIQSLERGGQHLLWEGAAGAGDLDDHEHDCDSLAHVAKASGKGVDDVHEHEARQPPHQEEEDGVSALHAEEVKVTGADERTLEQADAREQGKTSEVDLGVRAARLLNGLLARTRLHEGGQNDATDPDGERRVERRHGAAVILNRIDRVAIDDNRVGDEVRKIVDVARENRAHLIHVIGLESRREFAMERDKLLGGVVEHVGGLAQRVASATDGVRGGRGGGTNGAERLVQARHDGIGVAGSRVDVVGEVVERPLEVRLVEGLDGGKAVLRIRDDALELGAGGCGVGLARLDVSGGLAQHLGELAHRGGSALGVCLELAGGVPRILERDRGLVERRVANGVERRIRVEGVQLSVNGRLGCVHLVGRGAKARREVAQALLVRGGHTLRLGEGVDEVVRGAIGGIERVIDGIGDRADAARARGDGVVDRSRGAVEGISKVAHVTRRTLERVAHGERGRQGGIEGRGAGPEQALGGVKRVGEAAHGLGGGRERLGALLHGGVEVGGDLRDLIVVEIVAKLIEDASPDGRHGARE